MNKTIADLLEQLDRLAGYVRHQGDAAKDGVTASADHLIYLAESTRMAVRQLKEALHNAAAESERRRTGRHAWLLTRMRDLDAHISQLRLTDVNSADIGRDHRVFLDSVSGLIEWIYLTPGPTTVRVRVEGSVAYLYVDGSLGKAKATAWTCVSGNTMALSLIEDCAEPSIHLLRRLQVAGVQ
jgi:hypothetical protein